jgi:hypothetical protein
MRHDAGGRAGLVDLRQHEIAAAVTALAKHRVMRRDGERISALGGRRMFL